MNKVHKINGFVYVTSDDEIIEGDWFTDDNDSLKESYRLSYVQFANAKKIILTNDPKLTTIQQLTQQEVDYLNTVDECKVEHIGYVNAYNISIPKQETIDENDKITTIEQSIGYLTKHHYNLGYNQALKTLYSEEEVLGILIKLYKDNNFNGTISEWFNQNKKK